MISVRIESFEGPMDVLFQLIEKNKMDIYDIPIFELTQQYIAFVDRLEHYDMELMSEFIVMISTLLEIKSKMLLPQPSTGKEGTVADPREELINRLIEYKTYKNAADLFRAQQIEAGKAVFRKPDPSVIALFKQAPVGQMPDDVLRGVTLENLYEVFRDVLQKRERKTDVIRSGFRKIQKDFFTIEEKMEFITELIFIHKKIMFSDIFPDHTHKMEKVVTFLAVLELMKKKLIIVEQEMTFGEIIISQYSR